MRARYKRGQRWRRQQAVMVVLSVEARRVRPEGATACGGVGGGAAGEGAAVEETRRTANEAERAEASGKRNGVAGWRERGRRRGGGGE